MCDGMLLKNLGGAKQCRASHSCEWLCSFLTLLEVASTCSLLSMRFHFAVGCWLSTACMSRSLSVGVDCASVTTTFLNKKKHKYEDSRRTRLCHREW